MLEGEGLAQVLHQTVEIVQLKRMGSLVQIPTSDFICQPLRNLSQEGFVVIQTFGVSYKHQALCLTQIPERFYQALTTDFGQQEKFGSALVDLTVGFKEASEHALNCIIVAGMKGEVASSYFAIGRFIQRICVTVCHDEQWEIPFNQLTIHQGEGFTGLTQN